MGVGTQHRPHSLCSCKPSLRAVGVAGGRPLGGVPFAVVRGVWVQALSLPQLPALWAGCRGPLPTCCGRGCAGLGVLSVLAAGGRACVRVRSACAVFVCWWVRGGAVRAVVPWCVVLPPFVCLPCAPLSCATSWCCAFRGLWPCPLLRVRPSLSCWLPSFFPRCCCALYPFLYSALARPLPWRAFFPASALVFVSVLSFAYFLVLGVLLLLSLLVL